MASNTSRFTRKQCKLLLVGSPGSGKRTLAQALIRHDNLYVKIKTCEELPRIDQSQLPNLDFVIFMVDFTSAHSLAVLKDALQYISTDYLLDRVWIVVTKHDLTTKWAIDEKKFRSEVEYIYKVPLFWTNLSNEEECALVSNQLIQAIQSSAGYRPLVNPWIIGSCTYLHPSSTVVDSTNQLG